MDEKLKGCVLPILQTYEISSANEQWEMNKSTRIVIPKENTYIENKRLKEVVELVTAEFTAKEIPLNYVYETEDEASTEDILISLVDTTSITDQSDSKEAYKIEISQKGVHVFAASEVAVMYALRTIQHLAITNNLQLAAGTIIDYPDLEERRLHVDMGRKYFTKEWFIQHIRQLSYFKINTLQLHFSENLGFRIESEFDPQIVSKDGYLKKTEVKEIIAEAKKYGVQIIPSLDSPGHVEHILKTHPEYGQIDKHGQKSKVALDVTNPEAVTYMKGLYSEYMELFKGSTHFHIGADEYMEFDRPPFTTEYKEVLEQYAHEEFGEQYTWKDVIANYINEISEHVYENGFTPRIFNDGVYYGENDTDEPKQKVKMHDYISVDFWSQMAWNPSIAPLNIFIEKGHKNIYNLNANFFYYVLRNDMPDDGRKQHSFDHLKSDQKVYNEWTPGIFDQNVVSDDASFIKGAQLSIWCDNPEIATEDVITEDISKELRAFATKTWNVQSNEISNYNTFVKNYKKLGNVARFKKGRLSPDVNR